MPFEGTRFFEAVQMFSDEIALKYLRCLWFYWKHTHCTGLPDDDDGLRELCKCTPDLWPRAKALIFDNEHFFKLEGGKWHQKRNRDFHAQLIAETVKRQAQTLPARLATGRVSKSVTEDVSTPVGLVFNQRALERIEARLDQLRGQKPFSRAKKKKEWNELHAERKRLMNLLGLKA